MGNTASNPSSPHRTSSPSSYQRSLGLASSNALESVSVDTQHCDPNARPRESSSNLAHTVDSSGPTTGTSRLRNRFSNLKNSLRGRGVTSSQIPKPGAIQSSTTATNMACIHNESQQGHEQNISATTSSSPTSSSNSGARDPLAAHTAISETASVSLFQAPLIELAPPIQSLEQSEQTENVPAVDVDPMTQESLTASDSPPSRRVVRSSNRSTIPQRRSFAAPENSSGRRITRSRHSEDSAVPSGAREPQISSDVPQSGELVSPMPGEDQAAMLSRLLSVAAAATAASLVGHNNSQALRDAREVGGANFSQRSMPDAQEGNSMSSTSATDQVGNDTRTRDSSDLVDGSFDGFLSALQSGRLAQALRNGGNVMGEGNSDFGPQQHLNFFRMFRFSDPVSINGAPTAQEAEGQMVPIIIVGIRSVPPREDASPTSESLPSLFAGLDNPQIDTVDSRPATEASPTVASRGSERSEGESANISTFYSPDISRSRPATNTTTADFGTTTSSSAVVENGSQHALAGEQEATPSLTRPVSRQSVRSNLSSSRDSQRTSRTMSGIMDSVLDRLRSFRNDSNGQDAVESEPRRRRRRPLWRPFSSANSSTNAGETPNQTRSWIIYVLGGTYPEHHPILTTPSLFTDAPTYEDMLMLSNLIGPAKPETAAKEDIDSAGPTYDLTCTSQELSGHCLVCISDFQIGDTCRKLAKCSHYFHRECIDEWLITGRNTCPCCREQTTARNQAR